jgi:hypothetical protein
MIQRILLGSSLIIVLLAVFIFKPVPIVTEDRAVAETGTVTEIYEGGENDVVFRFAETTRRFYINRGLENGLELNQLREELIGKEITVKYPHYWTPLDWNNTVRHISKVEFGENVIFNELKPTRN